MMGGFENSKVDRLVGQSPEIPEPGWIRPGSGCQMGVGPGDRTAGCNRWLNMVVFFVLTCHFFYLISTGLPSAALL